MKRNDLSPAERIAVGCDYCRRAPRQYCVTRGLGLRYDPAHFVHADRLRKATVHARERGL